MITLAIIDTVQHYCIILKKLSYNILCITKRSIHSDVFNDRFVIYRMLKSVRGRCVTFDRCGSLVSNLIRLFLSYIA